MKTLVGIITSYKMPQTASVTVTTKWQHPLYKKYVKRSKKYACHVEGIEVKEGDKVVIAETKPISKTKRFKITEVVQDTEESSK